MDNRGQLVLSVAIIVIGLAFLFGNIFDINTWALCWPTLIILLGIGLILRPQLAGQSAASRQKLIGDIRRDGVWSVTDEQLWIGVGDVKLDMREAEIPVGTTRITIWSFVSPVRLYVPEGVGVAVTSRAFVTDARIFERKRESILAPFRSVSEEYETAESRILLELTSFVGDIRVRRV